MNTINLIGNICGDLDLKQTNNGKSVITLNLAVKRPHTKDITDFIPLVLWEQSAEYLSRYAHKGSRIGVSGKLTSRQYEDKNGNKRTAFEVVCDSVEICDSKTERTTLAPTNTNAPMPNFEEIGNEQDLPF